VAGDWKPQRTNRLLKNDGELKPSPHLKTQKTISFFKTEKEFPFFYIRFSVALEN
jgi:hypothetical protein